jgi:hypothetical protein
MAGNNNPDDLGHYMRLTTDEVKTIIRAAGEQRARAESAEEKLAEAHRAGHERSLAAWKSWGAALDTAKDARGEFKARAVSAEQRVGALEKALSEVLAAEDSLPAMGDLSDTEAWPRFWRALQSVRALAASTNHEEGEGDV